ncbi:LysR family transcriptional regulator substrate-binding protein [Subtercola boreus]|uniref:LysR substrate-binding domain-containing protein n=1 Tax=Subtercola boreus TaxID=120213 RepID=A0A3E0W7N5_9MICO|nr:LysR family transcriptional regulator substrate-binding protein [Subtercola boreus]RFA19023.1 hypothetical protein B7R24_12855 [Subtercola boreus]RFA19161.1 hypothetical protein B7R23_12835 [Subtercola boreus]RFA25623.1 hypothetical protein B7R25_12955 [Subtercola boreus]
MIRSIVELDRLVALAEQHSGTPEGDALVAAARALRAAASAPAPAPALADRGAFFTIAAAPGIPLDDLVDAFGGQNPHLSVTVTRSQSAARAVRTGAADVGVVRLPAHLHGLRVASFGTEQHVAALAAGDALAGRSSVSLDDLAHHHLLQNPDAVPEWRERAHELRGPTIGTRASLAFGVLPTLALQLEQVARANGIVIVPRSTADAEGRTDVAYLAVEGLDDRRLALAFAPGPPRQAVVAFTELAAGLR